MARIRTIKPEFWEDSRLGKLTPIDRLVFLGLISQADDAGRLPDNVRRIDGLLFPYTDDSSRDSLETLATLSRICRYTSAGGDPLLQVVNWAKHQRVDKPAKYTLPAPTTEDLTTCELMKCSRESPEDVARPSRSDLLPTTPEQGSSIPEQATNEQGSTDMSGSPNADVARVFEHFRLAHPRARLTKKRKTLIGGHLRDGYTVDDLILALDGLAVDKWHNDTGNLTIEYALRNADKIEQLQAVASDPSHPKRLGGNGTPVLSDASRKSLEAGQSWLNRRKSNG